MRDNKWESAKPAFGFALFHAPPARWKCGNRDSDFQALWEQWEACLWLSTVSIARHFHGALKLFMRYAFTWSEDFDRRFLRRASATNVGWRPSNQPSNTGP